MKGIFLTAAVVLAAVFVIGGCASAPKRDLPSLDIAVPDAWSTGLASGANEVEWWKEFGDLRLDSLVGEALVNNYDIVAAAARVDAAAATARIVRADLLPSATTTLQGARRRQNLIGIPIPGSGGVITTRSTSWGVSLDTSWEIDLWGRIRKGQAAAVADLEASWADLAGARLSIAAQTSKAWFALTEAWLQLGLAQQTVTSYETSADQVRTRYQQGVSTSLDLRLAISNLAAAKALLEQRRQQLDVAQRQIETLLGRYPAGALDPTSTLPAVPDTVPGGLPSELMIRRPDLLAAERRFAAAEARVSSARRAFFPSLKLTASGGTLTNQLEDLTNGDFSVWSIAAGVVQPIFQGGRIRANLSQSHAVSDLALAQYAGALLRAFSEVEMALVADQMLGRQVGHLREAAEQSESARRLAERQYESGLVDYITVLETQRRSLDSESRLIVVRRQLLDNRVNLHMALGGGFDLADEWTTFLETKRRDEPEASRE